MEASTSQDNKKIEITECQSSTDNENNLTNHPEKISLPSKNVNTEDCDDDCLDVDLSDLEIVSSSCDPNLNNTGLVIHESTNDAYKDIMTVCNATTQSIKKSISDFLSSRENVVIEEVDPTVELQESLNKKIADFERVVSGCFTPPSSESTSNENTESSVIISEEIKSPSVSPEKTLDEKPEEVTNTDCIKSELKTSPKTSEDDKPVIENLKQTSNIKLQPNIPTKDVCKSMPAEEEKLSKKQKSSASKKKGEKTIDQILKSLGNGTSEEKLQVLCKKHLEALEESRTSEQKVKQFERQIISQHREKEQLQAELNRMILAKSRLEGLCREMQRHSKAIKEESLLRLKEEEEKRKEVANKFQTTLNDIIALNQEVSKKNIQLREENAELATKLKSLVDNYETWEKNMSKIIQQKELEAQLAKAKHAKVNLLLKQETEKFLREKQSLLENLNELQKRCTVLTTNELQLRTELSDYTSKYEEFQNVLSNSSKVFASFKNDMEATSKKIKKLEKETNVYKQKWESSNKALMDMISHKEKQDKECQNAQQRIQTLEKLCRALQSERNDLQNQLNVLSSNSLPTTAPEVPLSPEAEVA